MHHSTEKPIPECIAINSVYTVRCTVLLSAGTIDHHLCQPNRFWNRTFVFRNIHSGYINNDENSSPAQRTHMDMFLAETRKEKKTENVKEETLHAKTGEPYVPEP